MGQILDQLMIPESEFQISFARSSGAGGQNVNKVNSKAVLRWHPVSSASPRREVIQRFINANRSRITNEGEIIITSEVYRDQPRNIADCISKLEKMLLEVLEPPKKRRKTSPTRGSKERRIDGKKKNAANKQARQKIRGY